MNAKEKFENIGFENVEQNDSKIVYVRYTDNREDIPRYKRACLKIIFDMHSRTVEMRGRNEKGSLMRAPVNEKCFDAILTQFIEIGWYRV